MGYYTSYTLDVKEGNTDLIEELVTSDENIEYAIDVYGDTNNECKWYEHEKDLKEFSKKHPETVFELKGEGEESGDIWVKYFKAGQMQSCPAKIVFDDYDETKLK